MKLKNTETRYQDVQKEIMLLIFVLKFLSPNLQNAKTIFLQLYFSISILFLLLRIIYISTHLLYLLHEMRIVYHNLYMPQ